MDKGKRKITLIIWNSKQFILQLCHTKGIDSVRNTFRLRQTTPQQFPTLKIWRDLFLKNVMS